MVQLKFLDFNFLESVGIKFETNQCQHFRFSKTETSWNRFLEQAKTKLGQPLKSIYKKLFYIVSYLLNSFFNKRNSN